jgi:ribosomal protein L17
VTCYFRHLQAIFEKAGIEVTKENKQELDKIIHKIISVKYKDCPNTWREVKKRIAADQENFVAELKKQWNGHS